MRIILKTTLFLLIPTIFIFLPFFANPNLLLARNNDLTEFFWPLFYYIKQNILINHQIPTTNTMWFAGTNLIGDPQNPVWYLPNIIFLFTSIDSGIIISLFAHTLFGTIGTYIASRKVFNFSKITSFFIASLFITSPIYFSFIEAGHWGLIIAWNWIPYLLISTYNLGVRPSKKDILLFVISFSSMYFNHVLTTTICLIPIVLFWLYKKSFVYPLVASVLALVIISPALYFQSKWLPETTRQILINFPETFPVWRGKIEFIKSIFLFNPETEKAITLGILPSFLALMGFIRLKKQLKLVIFVLIGLLALLALNNASPIYLLLLKINFFVLMRVATRVWPLVFFIGLFLVGYGMEKSKNKFVYLLGTIAIVESLLIGYSYLVKPVSARENIPEGIYQILQLDKSDYRVFCLTRCIPQKEAAIRGLKLVEGYGTLPGKSYFDNIQKALNAKWNKYTLSVPPFEAYLYQQLQPNALILSQIGTKYVISKYDLADSNFSQLIEFGEYKIYENRLFNPDIK